MRIAVTYDNESGEIFQHFGHTQFFKLYEIDGGEVLNTIVVDTQGEGHEALAGFLYFNNVDLLICGGIGGGAQMALRSAGVELCAGVSGKADDAVEALLKGMLDYNPSATCDHHDHEGGCHSGSCHEGECGHHDHEGGCHGGCCH